MGMSASSINDMVMAEIENATEKAVVDIGLPLGIVNSIGDGGDSPMEIEVAWTGTNPSGATSSGTDTWTLNIPAIVGTWDSLEAMASELTLMISSGIVTPDTIIVTGPTSFICSPIVFTMSKLTDPEAAKLYLWNEMINCIKASVALAVPYIITSGAFVGTATITSIT